MALNVGEENVADPEYITYLFKTNEIYDCYFVVGNGKHNTPVETIGVVKKMLCAHSLVFRAELHESQLKEKNGAEITDIFPQTFRNLLRHIYGFNNTSSLSFEDADDLLYAADKYLMENLKATLASRLVELLSYENICSLMNNRACFRVLELNSEINKILQFKTTDVLASAEFLNLCPKGFLAILEQEKLQVAEIELWRSAIKWAKHRAKSEDCYELRNELTTLLPHIRVCTVPLELFCRDIVPTRVLTDSEVVEVNLHHGNKDYKPVLPEICDVTKPRTKPIIKSEMLTFSITYSVNYAIVSRSVSIGITTCDLRVELCSLILRNNNNHQPQVYGVEIIQLDSAETSPPVSLTARVQAPDYTLALTPASADDDSEGVILQPNSRYRVTVSSSAGLSVFSNSTNNFSGNHFSVTSYPNNSAKSDDGHELRKQLTTHLPHIRVCSVLHVLFCHDIVPTRVLIGSEVIEICTYHGNSNYKPIVKSKMLSLSYDVQFHDRLSISVSIDIYTREHEVELCSLIFNNSNDLQVYTVEIRQEDNAESSSPVSLTASVQGPFYEFDLLASCADDDSEGIILRE